MFDSLDYPAKSGADLYKVTEYHNFQDISDRNQTTSFDQDQEKIVLIVSGM